MAKLFSIIFYSKDVLTINVERLDDFMALLKKSLNKELYYTIFEEDRMVSSIGLAFFGKVDGGMAIYQIKIPVKMSRAEAVREIRLIARNNDLTPIAGKIREIVMSFSG